jgi:hypothetical protein
MAFWSNPEVLIMLACAAAIPLVLIAPKGIQSPAKLGLVPVAILLAAAARAPYLRRWGQHGAALIFSFLLVSAARCMVPLPGAASAMYAYHVSPVVLIVIALATAAATTGTVTLCHGRLVISLAITAVIALASALFAYALLSHFYILEPQILRRAAQNALLIVAGVFLFKALTRNNASITVVATVCASGAVVLWCLDAGFDP